MAFKSLSAGSKVVALGVGAAAVGASLGLYFVPYYTDVYKVHMHVNEIPRFKRDMVEQEWKTLQGQQQGEGSLLKSVLTEGLMQKLKQYKTDRHGNLLLIMQEALHHPTASVGANAADTDCYDVFRPLFDPIITKLHAGFDPGRKKHPASSWGDEKKDWHCFDENLDKDGKFIKSARLECCRSLKYFTFQPLMTESDYFQSEYWIDRFFNQTPEFKENPQLKGKFYLLRKLNDTEKQEWNSSPFAFNKTDKRLQAAGFYEHWPASRGLFVNEAKNFAVQTNNEEHLKFISLARNAAEFKSAFQRLADGVKAIENVAPYSKNARLGYTNASPRHLGTGLNVSFELNLPKTASKEDFKKICDDLKLRFENKGRSTVLVSNSSQLGMNEFETVSSVFNGVKRLIEMERH